MISVGDAKQLSVEVFPLCLNLFDTRDKSHKALRLSKKVFMVLSLYLVSLIYIRRYRVIFCPFKTKDHLLSGTQGALLLHHLSLISNYK